MKKAMHANMYTAMQHLLDRFDQAGLVMHGVLLRLHGETLAEGYWKPYTCASHHRMFSVTKTLMALAVGVLLDEGRLSLSDTAASFLPELLPEHPHPYVMQATLRDLLRMASPHDATTYTDQDTEWTSTFFRAAPSHLPGTIFSYNSSATTTLAAVVERITGEAWLSFLQRKVLRKIGFSQDIRCVETPEGTAWSASGLTCTLRDIALVGQLLMQGGRWNGEQLISGAFIKAATSRQIDNRETGYAGYGYHIWCLPHGGFQLYGMGSQYVFCYPDAGLLFACMGDTQMEGARAGAIIHECVEGLYEASLANELIACDEERKTLAQRLESLAMRPVAGACADAMADTVNEVWYTLRDNPMHIDALQVAFSGSEGVFAYKKGGTIHRIRFGLGRLVEDTFPERYYGMRIGTISEKGYRCLSSAAWIEPSHLCLLVHSVDDHLGSLRIHLAFEKGEVAVHMAKAAQWFFDDYQGFAGGFAAT